MDACWARWVTPNVWEKSYTAMFPATMTCICSNPQRITTTYKKNFEWIEIPGLASGRGFLMWVRLVGLRLALVPWPKLNRAAAALAKSCGHMRQKCAPGPIFGFILA